MDIHPDDLKVAQLRESKMIGRWNEQDIEAESLLNRDRYRRLDSFSPNMARSSASLPIAFVVFYTVRQVLLSWLMERKLASLAP